jgi:hypothetical protein
MKVAVLGASNKPERYSYQAIQLLQKKGHVPFPVHPSLPAADGLKVYRSLSELPEDLHTITVYLSAKNQAPILDSLLNCPAQRFIFNPGAENPELSEKLQRMGKESLDACTLVLLNTGQF